MSTIIVGVLLAGLLIWAFNRTRKDIKNSKCGGCSGCSSKNSCQNIVDLKIK